MEGTPFDELTATQHPLLDEGTRLADFEYNAFRTITAIVGLYQVLAKAWEDI